MPDDDTPEGKKQSAASLKKAGHAAKRRSRTTKAGGAVKKCPPKRQSLDHIAKSVNPGKGTVNCGNIIDADIARLNGSNPAAVAPNAQDGSFPDIEKRHGTTLKWGQSLDDAFHQVKAGGNGATAILGIAYKAGGSHVVVMSNQGGTVGIIEGQNWGPGLPAGVITDPAVAKARYGADSDIGIGMLPP